VIAPVKMTEEEAAAKKAVSSIGDKNKRFNGKHPRGKIEELGQLVYKSNTKDSADMYIRTTEAVADYVGKEYGKDMRMLVKNQTERNFTEPRAPRKEESTPGLLEKYKTELGIYHKDRKEYNDNKSKVFVVILGQCLPSVRSKLESDDGYSTLENNDDVVGLLKELRKMAFLTGGEQDPFWTLQIALKRFATMSQGPTESVVNYHKRFLANVKVLEAQMGEFIPTKLVDGTTAADKKVARDKMMSMMMLSGADKKRYGKLLEDLNNNYLAGTDNYPSDVDSTVTLLSHYQDYQSNGGRNKVDSDGDGRVETSFAQHKKKEKQKDKQKFRIQCWTCGEYGHMARDCRSGQSNAQIDQVDESNILASWNNWNS
jgi:hypothetical protein